MKRHLRIVLLEGNAADAELIMATIERAGLKAEYRRIDSHDEFVLAVARFEPDVVVSDQSLAQFNSVAALEVLRDMRAATPLIVFSAGLDEHAAVACVRAGAEDLVLKVHKARLPAAIESALRAHREVKRLSPRQLQVLRLIAEGSTSRVTAKRLHVSVKTVETHRTTIMRRLGAHDVTHLVRLAIRAGVISQVE